MAQSKKKIKYIKVTKDNKAVKIVYRRFASNNIRTVKALIKNAGLEPVTFTELILLVDGPYGDEDIPERCRMATLARQLINLNSVYYTDLDKEFGIKSYRVCTAVGEYGDRWEPDIKVLNSPKYIGFTQSISNEQQYITSISKIFNWESTCSILRSPGLKYTFDLAHLDEAISIQARTTLDGYYCTNLRTFYPSYRYSPRFDTEIIVTPVKGSAVSKKHYVGFGKLKSN